MKKLLAVFALLAISGIPTLAQDRGEETPLFDVNAGYTFLRWQAPPAALSPSNYDDYNGFNVGGSFNFKKWMGLALDVSGTYNTSAGIQTSIYTYQAGPRIFPLGHHKLTPYVQGLVGAATYHSPVVFPTDETHLSFEVGGGAEYAVWKNIALRGEADYQWTQFLHGEARADTPPVSADNQNNFKASVGVVVRFGKK